jgi:hypothetical protein
LNQSLNDIMTSRSLLWQRKVFACDFQHHAACKTATFLPQKPILGKFKTHALLYVSTRGAWRGLIFHVTVVRSGASIVKFRSFTEG